MKPISANSKISMHNNSHIILKSKIRIIHLFAPKIIQTDVANFREMVQRLTGKPPPPPAAAPAPAADNNRNITKKNEQDGINSPRKPSGERLNNENEELYECESPTDSFGSFDEMYHGLFEEQPDEFSVFPKIS